MVILMQLLGKYMGNEIKNMTFEESFNELNSIVDKINNDNVSINEMTSLFERAVELNNHCKKILNNTKGKIQKLVNDNDDFKLSELN